MENEPATEPAPEVNFRQSIELTKIEPGSDPRESHLSDQPSKAAYSKPEEIYAPEKIGGYMGFIKYGLVAFNTIIWLLGLVITAVSIWLVVDPTLGNFQVNVDMTHLRSAAYVGIAVGVFILTIGLIGCCGAVRESVLLLGIFLAVGILFIILEAVAAGVIWAAINNKETEDKLSSLITKAIGNRKANPSARYFLDLLQDKLKCCGISGPDAYDPEEMPRSCVNPDTGIVYETGCVRNMLQYLKSKAAIFGGITIATLLLQVGAIVLTICLIFAIRQAAKPIF